ncbi:hypothetical protein BG011_002841 [Mortierella polycephala]|uniref:Uncharacterized protein n=1 Tax=Mortierella polycephala TaxID=41804 RepID=A0A9P6U4D4_9FUNG|nr:hypothetical protein BG011_002841 [Mortierella polycephala]
MASRVTTSVPLGTASDAVENIDRFFHLVDARYWYQIEQFFRYHDPSKTVDEHFESYRSSLDIIRKSTLVKANIKAQAQKLFVNLKYTEFFDTFSSLLEKVERDAAQSSVRGLYLGVTNGLNTKRLGTGPSRAREFNKHPRSVNKAVGAEAGVNTIRDPVGESRCVLQALESSHHITSSIPDYTSFGSTSESVQEGLAEANVAGTDDALQNVIVAKTVAPDTKSSTKKHKIARSFTDKARLSFGDRFTNLGEKWTLKSGTVVEHVLYEAGSSLDVETYSPTHSFMLDLDDPSVEKLFSPQDWQEITSDLPTQAFYNDLAYNYLDSFSAIKSKEELEASLERRPADQESQLIFHCLNQWVELFKTDPSPFIVVSALGEAWWLNNVWGLCARVASGVPHSFILPGEKTGVASAERRNQNLAPMERRKVGYRADLIWRTLDSPEQDWAVAEAACDWDPNSDKYKFEGAFKLPRHMHDILCARTAEVDGPDQLRNEFVSGLIIGGLDRPLDENVQRNQRANL